MNKIDLEKETNVLIGDLPDETDWDALMYKIYVRQKIEKGLKDSVAGHLCSTDQVKRKLNFVS